MATDAADLTVPSPTSFASPVVVICEDTPTPKGPIILEFDATCDSAASSLLFTFTRTDTTGRHADHLQIHPGRIASLTRTVHEPAAPGDQDTPSLLLVRPQFKAKQNLACLHFRLRSLVPTDDRPDSADKDDDGDSLETVAAASIFSVYFPHDTLRRATYRILLNALRPYLDQPAPAEQVGLLPTAPQAGGNTCSDQGIPTASRETTTSPPDYGNDNVRARAGPSQPPYSDRDTAGPSKPPPSYRDAADSSSPDLLRGSPPPPSKKRRREETPTPGREDGAHVGPEDAAIAKFVLDRVEQIVDGLREDGRRLQAENRELRDAVDGLREDGRRLHAENRELGDTVDGLREDGRRLQAENRELRDAVDGIRVENGQLCEALGTVADLATVLESLIERVDELEERLGPGDGDALDVRIERLESDVIALEEWRDDQGGDEEQLEDVATRIIEEELDGIEDRVIERIGHQLLGGS